MKLRVAVLTLLIHGGAHASGHADFLSLAAECAPGVHPSTLAAVVRQESAGNPYAIGVNAPAARLPRQPSSRAEAESIALSLFQRGVNFDGGLGQVNVNNLDWLGLSVPDLFDPCRNLEAAAMVLTECYSRSSRKFGDQQQALHAALSCYNTGNFRDGFANGYVIKVASNATLDVPALLPVGQGSSEAVRLTAQRQAKPISNAQKPLPGSIADVFGGASTEVFLTDKSPELDGSSDE